APSPPTATGTPTGPGTSTASTNATTRPATPSPPDTPRKGNTPMLHRHGSGHGNAPSGHGPDQPPGLPHSRKPHRSHIPVVAVPACLTLAPSRSGTLVRCGSPCGSGPARPGLGSEGNGTGH